MTIINRALHKVYQRRSDSGLAESSNAAMGESLHGWASHLRQPVNPDEESRSAAPSRRHPVNSPLGRATASPISPPTIAFAPLETKTRIDPAHVPATAAAKPALESAASGVPDPSVESWSWPSIVGRLLECPVGGGLRGLAASLKRLAFQRDLRCIAFSGTGRNVGRTSIVLTLANVLVEDPALRVVIVDSDLRQPGVGAMLSLSPAAGLWNVACDRTLDATAAIAQLTQNLSVVPLVESVSLESVDRGKIAAMQTFLRELRRANDLVLVDAGPWESLVPPLAFESRAIDAFLSVCRGDAPESERIDAEQVDHPGLDWLGTVETFAS